MIIKTTVKHLKEYFGVYSLRDIKKGEIIFSIEGKIVFVPSKYSIQVEITSHIEPFSKDIQDNLSHWQFLNHSCSPNAFINIEKSTLVAFKNISVGEEVRFNYNATEYEMSSPFQCKCGSEKCYGEIKGFKYLSEADQKALYPKVSPHIQLLSEKNKHLV